MICKRIRLNERRYKPPPEINLGPISRPCTSRPENIESSNLSCSSSASSTPRSKRFDDQQITAFEKTPLIVMTLSMPPEAKTLVPQFIKRDPRKNPPFCQQLSTLTKSNDSSKKEKLPEIYIKGVEITENKLTNELNRKNNRNSNEMLTSNESELNLENSFDGIHGIFEINRGFLLNFDGYEMDTFGHLPGDPQTPHTTTTDARPICVRRTPSPSTRQIIRVDVSVNRCKNLKKLLK